MGTNYWPHGAFGVGSQAGAAVTRLQAGVAMLRVGVAVLQLRAMAVSLALVGVGVVRQLWLQWVEDIIVDVSLGTMEWSTQPTIGQSSLEDETNNTRQPTSLFFFFFCFISFVVLESDFVLIFVSVSVVFVAVSELRMVDLGCKCRESKSLCMWFMLNVIKPVKFFWERSELNGVPLGSLTTNYGGRFGPGVSLVWGDEVVLVGVGFCGVWIDGAFVEKLKVLVDVF